MKRIFLATVICAVGGSACVNVSLLSGFDCDDAGRCKAPSGYELGGGTNANGGGSGGGGGGGNVTGGGGGTLGGGGGGGGPVCSTSTCTGCCDASGTCRSGDDVSACGGSGFSCAVCAAGTRCAAAVCQPLSANGGMCLANAQCGSGFCVSGLCCNSACTGNCESCNSMGTEGVCSPLAEATQPAVCGDYACDGVSGSCPSTCTSSRQCASGRFCDNGRCVTLKVQGVSCASSAECQTGFCADGVCCNQACSGSCDRCNLSSASLGTCAPAPASDPGSPACGGAIVCNGTLADCPIFCGTGCPSNTFCSGTYCSAKKTNGVTCGASTECQSNFCVDGVCCNTGCADSCDACSVAQGAVTNGTCSLLGPSRICRGATSTCDVEERCNGTVATCPGNSFADAGVGCGTTSFTAWSTCDGGSACASSGGQTRTRSDQRCSGTGSCAAIATVEGQACLLVTEGVPCGSVTFGAYTACSYTATCSTAGTRTRTRTDPLCASGTCSAAQSTETDSAGCTRSTTNVSCGAATFGPYGTCTFGSTCVESGTRTRTRTDPVCQSGACGSTTATENDSTGCARTTVGQSCGTTSTGAYGACSYAGACSASGTRSRTVSTFTCGSGACNTSTMTENDTAGCARTTTGNSCGTTQTSAYTACSYANACSNTGSRTRTVTTYSCGAAGSCDPNTTTETDTAGCNRAQDGQTCSPPAYGAYGACSYANACSNTGSRTRSVTTYTCGNSACNPASGTDTDTAGCARNQNGTSCGTGTVGAWSSCGYPGLCINNGARTRSVTSLTCGSGTCNTTSSTETDSTACVRNTTGDICGAPSCGTCSIGCGCDCLRTQNCTGPVCNASQACVTQTYQQNCGSCTGCLICAKPDWELPPK